MVKVKLQSLALRPREKERESEFEMHLFLGWPTPVTQHLASKRHLTSCYAWYAKQVQNPSISFSRIASRSRFGRSIYLPVLSQRTKHVWQPGSAVGTRERWTPPEINQLFDILQEPHQGLNRFVSVVCAVGISSSICGFQASSISTPSAWILLRPIC